MRIELIPTDQINKESHQNLILESVEYSPFYHISHVENVINSHLDKLIRNPDSYVMIIAKDDQTGKLLGQLLVGLNFGDFGLIQPWQPIIYPNTNRMEIAIKLIEKSKIIIKLYQKTKIEIWMELESDHDKLLHTEYEEWYHKCKFQETSTEYNMALPYSMLP